MLKETNGEGTFFCDVPFFCPMQVAGGKQAVDRLFFPESFVKKPVISR